MSKAEKIEIIDFIKRKNQEHMKGISKTLPHVLAIETKSGILLTHVSMMIAVTGIMFAVGQHSLFLEFVIGIELVAYLLLALACIRCQLEINEGSLRSDSDKSDDPSKGAQYLDFLYGELLYRGWLFKSSFKLLYILTFILALTIFMVLFADDVGRVWGNFSQTSVSEV